MKQLIITALLATAALSLSTSGSNSQGSSEKDYDAMFREYKATHLKSYANEAEEGQRFKNFVINMRKAEVLQAANPLAVFGANVFADMSEEEFFSQLANGAEYFATVDKLPREVELTATDAERAAAAGTKIDWRQKGAVTGVKNQGSCGSCWSFSTTGNIEGQWKIAGNALTPLSEQELVSCDTIDSACNGGLMDNAFKWLINNKGGKIVTEKAYPYTSGSGSVAACKATASMQVGAVITGYTHIEKNENTLATYVLNRGPIAVAVDATSFKSYKSGILTSCTNSQMNHGVLAVGYDDTNVPPYWIIKNSWGTSWGESGYIRLAKGSNQCLINSYSTTANVKK